MQSLRSVVRRHAAWQVGSGRGNPGTDMVTVKVAGEALQGANMHVSKLTLPTQINMSPAGTPKPARKMEKPGNRKNPSSAMKK